MLECPECGAPIDGVEPPGAQDLEAWLEDSGADAPVQTHPCACVVLYDALPVEWLRIRKVGRWIYRQLKLIEKDRGHDCGQARRADFDDLGPEQRAVYLELAARVILLVEG